MLANDAFRIAVLAGDGIGRIMAPALDVLRRSSPTPGLKFRFEARRAVITRETANHAGGTVKLCEQADISCSARAVFSVRYPDNTEIMPQVELRFIFDLRRRAAVSADPQVPSRCRRGRAWIDLVLIRVDRGLFASMGKGVVTEKSARDVLITQDRAAVRILVSAGGRRKTRGRPGRLACIDEYVKAYAFFRKLFDEAPRHEGVRDRIYVDACAAMLVRKP